MARVQPKFQQKRIPKFKSVSDVEAFFGDLNKQIDASYKQLADAINNSFTPTPTASLPAASAQMDGQAIIEIAAGPTLNLIIYADGIRARITGTVF